MKESDVPSKKEAGDDYANSENTYLKGQGNDYTMKSDKIKQFLKKQDKELEMKLSADYGIDYSNSRTPYQVVDELLKEQEEELENFLRDEYKEKMNGGLGEIRKIRQLEKIKKKRRRQEE